MFCYLFQPVPCAESAILRPPNSAKTTDSLLSTVFQGSASRSGRPSTFTDTFRLSQPAVFLYPPLAFHSRFAKLKDLLHVFALNSPALRSVCVREWPLISPFCSNRPVSARAIGQWRRPATAVPTAPPSAPAPPTPPSPPLPAAPTPRSPPDSPQSAATII